MGKKVNLFIVFLFLTLLTLPLLIAQPPLQETDALRIEYSKFDALQQDSQHQFFFHTINDTQVLDNNTLNCDFDLFNDERGLIFEKDDLTFRSPNEWSVNVSAGNLSELGEYSFIVSCNSSSQAGFVSDGFDVTYNGDKIDTGQAIIYISLFAFFIFIFIIILFGIKELPASNERDEEGKILSITYLKYLRPIGWMLEYMLVVGMLFLSSNIAFAYLGEQLFAQILFTLFQISFGLAPLVVIVWMIWIWVKLFHDKQFQRILNRGMFPQGRKL